MFFSKLCMPILLGPQIGIPASSAIFFIFLLNFSSEVSARIVRDFDPAFIASNTALSTLVEETAITVLSGLVGISKIEL